MESVPCAPRCACGSWGGAVKALRSVPGVAQPAGVAETLTVLAALQKGANAAQCSCVSGLGPA